MVLDLLILAALQDPDAAEGDAVGPAAEMPGLDLPDAADLPGAVGKASRPLPINYVSQLVARNSIFL